MNESPNTIVLIHGFWVTPRSWEHWKEHYEANPPTAGPGLSVGSPRLEVPLADQRLELAERVLVRLAVLSIAPSCVAAPAYHGTQPGLTRPDSYAIAVPIGTPPSSTRIHRGGSGIS